MPNLTATTMRMPTRSRVRRSAAPKQQRVQRLRKAQRQNPRRRRPRPSLEKTSQQLHPAAKAASAAPVKLEAPAGKKSVPAPEPKAKDGQSRTGLRRRSTGQTAKAPVVKPAPAKSAKAVKAPAGKTAKPAPKPKAPAKAAKPKPVPAKKKPAPPPVKKAVSKSKPSRRRKRRRKTARSARTLRTSALHRSTKDSDRRTMAAPPSSPAVRCVLNAMGRGIFRAIPGGNPMACRSIRDVNRALSRVRSEFCMLRRSCGLPVRRVDAGAGYSLARSKRRWTYVHLEGSPSGDRLAAWPVAGCARSKTRPQSSSSKTRTTPSATGSSSARPASKMLWPHIDAEYQQELEGIARGRAIEGRQARCLGHCRAERRHRAAASTTCRG